jgi:molecular chaperone DnaK
MEGDHDQRGGPRRPVGLLVRLSYGSVDEFASRFAVNLSRGGVFMRTRDPKPVGTVLAFELRLTTDEPVIRGEGVVRWIQPEDRASKPTKAPGMGVQFTRLDDRSRVLVERIVAGKELRTPTPVAMPAAMPATAPAPILTPPRPLPAATLPAQADLSLPHRVEQIAAGPTHLDVPLPASTPAPGRKSRAVIGIDLGTTNSCAAFVRDGRPYVLPTREGHHTVPSIVAMNARNAIVVGHLAKAQLLTNPRATVHGAKRLIGRAWDTPIVHEIRRKAGYDIVPSEDGLAAVRLGDRVLSLEEVSGLILREVKEVAQNHLGEEVNRAVVTVPAYYSERQRAAVRQAGALAGLHVERILNEPTAAALAYAYGRSVNERVLVYDLGGGTFDASVLELQDQIYEVVSTGGDTFLGGVDFDARIVDRLLERWEAQHGVPFAGDRVALSRLVDAAERAKCALSERKEFVVQLPFLAEVGGKPAGLEATLTRDELVVLVEPLVERTLQVCREVLAARSLGPGDLDAILLVGGQSRMPLVHQRVEAFFGKPPSHAVHPDEAVAAGAALLAHSLGKADGVVLIDVLPMSIRIGLSGGRTKTIIERNTPLPVRKQYGLTTTTDGQTEFELVVLQGEGPAAADCEYLGTLTLADLPPGPRGMVKIAVTFELGAESLLTVTARELNTNRQVRAVMTTRESPEAVRRRLETAGEPTPSGTPAPFPSAAAQPAAPARKPGLFGRLFGG